MKKEHAEHNEKTCDYLFSAKDGDFSDWVVTSAFYAALHFVQHEIFPLTIGNEGFKTFDDYISKISKREVKRPDKHGVTIDLVKVHLNMAHSSYRWLYDASWNARYKNYKVSQEYASTARRRLEQLKAFLKK